MGSPSGSGAAPAMREHAQPFPGAADIAYCPTHGLHGERGRCFVCDKPCAQVTMIPLDPMLDMIERLMSPLFEVREDAGAEAITLLRAHGRLG
jgi:hypothetical protein